MSALQVRLFAREIKSVGLLSHPNVVQIFQADVTDDGELFYAMELIDGASLTTVLARRGPLPAPLARRVLDEILAGLEAAHRVGVFHLDVKPSNVMLRSLDGQEQVRELGAAVLLDFGIARLADGPSEGGGDHLQLGTPGYMAPEQREGRRCDARTDVYAAGVVLYEMLTGLRSAGCHSAITAAELKQVADTSLREILATALDLDADRRFATVKAFRAALAGDAPPPHAARPASPFFYLSAHDESDRWRLFGRDGEIERLLGRVLAERLVVVGGPSGVGKTSLLRAGVIPELRACGCLPVYLPCRRWPLDAARTILDSEASELVEALRARCKSQRVVLVFDHVEALAPQQHEGVPALPRLLDELARLLATTEDLDVAIMLSLREEFVGRLVPLRHAHGGPLAELAVGPLPQVAAERALREPLEERGLRLDADLMETLFADLGGAARGLAGLRSGHTALEGALGGAVYPPHLQMVASLLYESLDADEERLTLAHYRALGGLDGVLREHLDRTLDKTLSAEQAKLARDLFKELVTSEGTRATRSEKDLLAAVSHRGVGAQGLHETLTLLQHQRLVVSVRLAEDRVGWELVHDSLVPRIRAWMDRRELDQRRAVELLRLHLNRSLEGSPHLLTRRDVREIVRFPEVLAQVDGQQGPSDPDEGLSARRLLALSRRHYRLRYGSVALSGIALVCLLAALGWMRLREREARLRDWAESRLTLRLFEISGGQRVQGTAADFPQLELRLHRVGAPYTLAPGAPIPGERYRIRKLSGDGDLSPRFSVAASGGSYALVIHGRSRRGEEPCPPAVLWHVSLPGYVEVSRRGSPPQLTLTVPTCAERRRHLHPIPGGAYYSGDEDSHGWYARRRYVLGTYSIDRFEVSNASFRRYVKATASLTGTRLPDVSYDYGKRLSLADSPVQGVSWREARNYCLWMGKSLPTQAQHEKAARGGIWLDGDATKQRRNPLPRRRYPWGNDAPKRPADPRVAHWPRAYLKAHPERNGPSPVDSYPLPSAAYPPLRHLVGNVGEWLADGPRQPMGSRAADGTRNPHGPMDGSIRRRLVHYGYWSSRWSEGLWISWAEPVHADTPGAGAGIRCATPPQP